MDSTVTLYNSLYAFVITSLRSSHKQARAITKDEYHPSPGAGAIILPLACAPGWSGSDSCS